MAEFGVEPARTLMIGDTTHDLQLAANAGTHSVGVSYGAHPPDGFGDYMPVATYFLKMVPFPLDHTMSGGLEPTPAAPTALSLVVGAAYAVNFDFFELNIFSINTPGIISFLIYTPLYDRSIVSDEKDIISFASMYLNDVPTFKSCRLLEP